MIKGETSLRKKIRLMRVTYPDIRVPQWQGRRLRGFFASLDEADSLLHNHEREGESVYRYPLVQYKVIRRHPVIVAIEEGISAVYPLVMEQQELTLGENAYPCGHMDIDLRTGVLGATAEPRRYRFCAPWFALNQRNYQIYFEADAESREALLEQILTGNLLSLAKGMGVTVDRTLRVQARLRPQKMYFKDENVIGFAGYFSVNFAIPPLLGLGKSVSRGFGAVIPVGSGKDRPGRPEQEHLVGKRE